MRRFWIMLLTISVVLVIALPAAAKPDRPKPPKPPKAVSIAVSLDAAPVWVHEGADLISYTVTLENKTSNNIEDVAVKLTTTDTGVYQGPVDVWEFPGDAVPGVVPANSSVWLRFYLYVHQFEEAKPCLAIDPDSWPDECALLASAEVLINDVLLTQTTMSTPLMPDPPCKFTYTFSLEPDKVVSDQVPVSDICIWTLPEWPDSATGSVTGVWEITLTPTHDPDKPNRPIGASVSVRDGVPGNWCTLAIGTSSTFGGRWRVGDDPIVGEVYLPGKENLGPLGLDDGVCLGGGAGGDYFAVGNPDSFYLSANGLISVKWIREVPPSSRADEP